MPILSIRSAVCSLMPAVSIKRYTMPPKVKLSSMVSRVVPAMALTMALSSLISALSKVDLPALGLPAITVGTPFLMALPILKVSTNCNSILCRLLTKVCNSGRLANSTSSSLKSSSNSISEAKLISFSRSMAISFEKPPRIWFMAVL